MYKYEIVPVGAGSMFTDTLKPRSATSTTDSPVALNSKGA
jgi:hypothetical protein